MAGIDEYLGMLFRNMNSYINSSFGCMEVSPTDEGTR